MKITRFMSAAAILFCTATLVLAANIPIVNPNFDADVLNCSPGPTCNTGGPISGWTESPTGSGVEYSASKVTTVSYPAGAPGGNQIAALVEDGPSANISQILTTNLKANDTYTLTFYVGLRADTTVFAPSFGCYGFNVSLLAGGNVLNSLLLADGNASCSLVATGAFTRLSFTYTSGSNPVGLGSPLQIVLTAQGSGSNAEPAEIDFTEVTLTDTSGSTQPYYFSDLAFSGGYQTTLTYVNYSPQAVT